MGCFYFRSSSGVIVVGHHLKAIIELELVGILCGVHGPAVGILGNDIAMNEAEFEEITLFKSAMLATKTYETPLVGRREFHDRGAIGLVPSAQVFPGDT